MVVTLKYVSLCKLINTYAKVVYHKHNTQFLYLHKTNLPLPPHKMQTKRKQSGNFLFFFDTK